MKQIFFFLILAGAIVSCQDNATSKIDASKQKERSVITPDQVDASTDAQMEFEEIEWDFGTIEQGDVVEYSYRFVNTGSDPLIISNARGSCGCTVPEWPRVPVEPGESGVINVKFNSKGKKGKQNKRVTLTTNMVPNKMVLTVKGEVNVKE